MHDLVITGGTVVDGAGAAPRARRRGRRRRPHRRGGDGRGFGSTPDRRRGLVSSRPGFVDIHTHLDAQLAWDPHGIVVVLARRDLGGDGQLRGHVRPLQARRPRVPGRDDGVGRGHPGRQHHGRAGLGLGDLRRVPRARRALAQGPQRRRHGRALRGAPARDGRAQPRRDAGDRRRHRRHVRARRRGDRRRRARLLDVAHPAAPRARRPPGARHLGRRRGAARHRRGAGSTRSRRLRGGASPRRTGHRRLRRHPRRGGHDGRHHRASGRPRDVRSGPQLPARRPLPPRPRLRQRAQRHRWPRAAADHRAGHRAPVRSLPPHAVRRIPLVAGASACSRSRSG